MVVVEVLSGDDNCGGIVVVINGVRWQWQKLGNDTQQRVASSVGDYARGCPTIMVVIKGVSK